MRRKVRFNDFFEMARDKILDVYIFTDMHKNIHSCKLTEKQYSEDGSQGKIYEFL